MAISNGNGNGNFKTGEVAAAIAVPTSAAMMKQLSIMQNRMKVSKTATPFTLHPSTVLRGRVKSAGVEYNL